MVVVLPPAWEFKVQTGSTSQPSLSLAWRRRSSRWCHSADIVPRSPERALELSKAAAAEARRRRTLGEVTARTLAAGTTESVCRDTAALAALALECDHALVLELGNEGAPFTVVAAAGWTADAIEQLTIYTGIDTSRLRRLRARTGGCRRRRFRSAIHDSRSAARAWDPKRSRGQNRHCGDRSASLPFIRLRRVALPKKTPSCSGRSRWRLRGCTAGNGSRPNARSWQIVMWRSVPPRDGRSPRGVGADRHCPRFGAGAGSDAHQPGTAGDARHWPTAPSSTWSPTRATCNASTSWISIRRAGRRPMPSAASRRRFVATGRLRVQYAPVSRPCSRTLPRSCGPRQSVQIRSISVWFVRWPVSPCC